MALVSGHELPVDQDERLATDGRGVLGLGRARAAAAGAALGVVNVWSGPLVVPALLVATIRTWYKPPAIRFVRFADTDWLLVPEPTCWGAVDWS